MCSRLYESTPCFQEMLRDTVTNLLLLDPQEMAKQLTIASFQVI